MTNSPSEQVKMLREALKYVRHRDSRWYDDDVVTPALKATEGLEEKLKPTGISEFHTHIGEDPGPDKRDEDAKRWAARGYRTLVSATYDNVWSVVYVKEGASHDR